MIDALTSTADVPAAPGSETTMVVPRTPPDPHASKLPPNHPGLQLKRPPFRVLRRGPIVGISMALAGLGAVAFARGFLVPDNPPTADMVNANDPEAPVAPNLVVADLMKNAPGNNSPVNPGRPPAAPKISGLPMSPAPGDQRAAALTQAMEPMPNGRQLDPKAPPAAPRPPSPEREARRQELARAKAGGMFFSGEGETPRPSDRQTLPPAAPAIASDPGHAAARQVAEQDPNGQGAKSAFMREAAKDRTTYSATQVSQPLSPYEVKAGAVIPTTLITAINSDLPGEVVAQVRENVYDTVTGAYLLIPQGSRLLARYDSAVTYGQERVLLCWQRLIRPDGSSISLECAPGVDLSGQAGFSDEVDNHWGKLITGVVLSSMLAAVTQAAAGSVEGYRPNLAQSFAAGAAGDLASAGQQITRKNIGLQPTVKIRPGYSVNVLVNKDLVIPPYRTR